MPHTDLTVAEPAENPNEPALLSEPALDDWNRAEEDAAWAHLQSEETDAPVPGD